MCDKSVLENSEKLESVPDCCKNQKMYNQDVDNMRKHRICSSLP